MSTQKLREDIANLVEQYANQAFSPKVFLAGESAIPPSGKVIGAPEIKMMVDACLDGWLTTGRFNREFERRLGEFIGVKHVLTTVSGSAANLLALATLTSPSSVSAR